MTKSTISISTIPTGRAIHAVLQNRQQYKSQRRLLPQLRSHTEAVWKHGYVITLCSCGSHDGCIGNRRTMVSTNRTCHAGRHGNDHHLRTGFLKYRNNDRDQDTKSSPGCTGSKCKSTSNQENNGRKESSIPPATERIASSTNTAAPSCLS